MVHIPINDLKKQNAVIRHEIDSAIAEVIDSADFILGREVRAFEEEVERYCLVKYANGVSNGTDAIRLALLALGIKPGDGVICPAFTYYATAGAIASLGAVPVFADIDGNTYTISADTIEHSIKRHKGYRIKAIVAVHLYGQCANMDDILKLALRNKLNVIEDCAQAFGAEYRNKKAGTLGDCGTVSFFPGKNLGAFGDAGMILTNNYRISETLRILRNQGNKEKYYHKIIGYNNRMDSIQAAVLRVKLKYLNAWNKKRQENAEYYNKKMSGLDLILPNIPEYTTHIFHQYVIRISNDNKKIIEYLRSKGIDCRVYYPLPLHLQKCFSCLNYKKGDFIESEKAATQTLAIPVYPDLTKDEMDYIISSIKDFLK